MAGFAHVPARTRVHFLSKQRTDLRIPSLHRRALVVAGWFTSPLTLDDYTEVISPLWSTRETRGRVEAVERSGAVATTLTIRPSRRWTGHVSGQYVRLGVEVGGVYHWRAYSLTSDPARADGCIAITVKLVPSGTVSPQLCTRIAPGAILRLGDVEGTFVLPEPPPEKLLFISAGSGITPVMSMLRSLKRRSALRDVQHVHCARSAEEVIFADELKMLDERHRGYHLQLRLAGVNGRLAPSEVDRLCPDWRARETFACGPPLLLAALRERWHAHGSLERMHIEHFTADDLLDDRVRGEGGTIEFRVSGTMARSDGASPILAEGERAGVNLPFGCRMGICGSCVGRLRSGRVRDLRTGSVHGRRGELLRTCINAPEGPIVIDL